jgi:TolB-like protein/SAM-dependent methyltransferase
MHYEKTFTDGLQFMWGKGFLSPGGPEEVSHILQGIDLRGLQVLDIGSGLGGVDVLLVKVHGAARVTGVDIEGQLVATARERIAEEGLSGRIDFHEVEPGPLPFAAQSFDVVFSKDAMVHIADKLAAYREIMRVLKPGGKFIAADWLWGNGAATSPAVTAWLGDNPLGFVFTTRVEAEAALGAAGFFDIQVIDRRLALQAANRKLLEMLQGPDFAQLVAIVGQESAQERLAGSKGRQAALDSGDLVPCHLKARKPLADNPSRRSEAIQRRLAAILAADVAGYSRLMGADEEGTIARLKAHRSILLDARIEEHKGRIVKTTGDGMLVEFASVVAAVRCAVDIQRGMADRNADIPDDERIAFRIGINVGDIMIDGGDIFGDGVNVAARLEAMAEPGGICISSRVQEDVRGKLDVSFDDAGEQNFKNIAWPVRVYHVRLGTTAVAERPALSVPAKPSIVVLPFQNMSGDPEQDYFADGMVEDIITALSRFGGLFVIARNSSFAYKGKAVDVKQVGRELGVRYVLEGSVRRARDRLRITGQLIEASTLAHLWADRFDGALEDIFDLQDQVTASVVGAIAPKIERAEIERSRRKPTESLDAYDYYLRGMASLHSWSREGNDEALSHFYRAIALDPGFAAAHGMAARSYVQRRMGRWMKDPAYENGEAVRLARRAVELGPDDAIAVGTAGFTLVDFTKDFVAADVFTERAITLNPNLAWAWLFSGWVKVSLGEADSAIERVTRAMRLSPQDPQSFSMLNAVACAHFVAGRYEQALAAAEIAMRDRPNFILPCCIGAASAVHSGRMDDARRIMATLRGIAPDLSISTLDEIMGFKRAEDLGRWVEGLRKAGLPE